VSVRRGGENERGKRESEKPDNGKAKWN